MIIRTKTVNNSSVKGIIITADTLRDLRKWLASADGNPDRIAGAKGVIDFLDVLYDKV